MHVRFTFLAGLVMTAIAVAQQPTTENAQPEANPKAASDSLEALLKQALKHSAEIQLAEAKVRETEAQLHTAKAIVRQARTQTAQKVMETHSKLNASKQVLAGAENMLNIYKKSGAATSKIESAHAEREMLSAKAAVVELQTQLDAIVGRLPSSIVGVLNAPSGTAASHTAVQEISNPIAKRMPPPDTAERMHKALHQTVKLPVETLTLNQILDQIRSQVPGVPISNHFRELGGAKASFDFKGELDLASCFQLLEDKFGLKFFVRDYGFLAGAADPAWGPVPDDAMSLQEFAKTHP
ncbi:MAG: hypothetical protein ACJ8C4_14895 [Gemmataceae bacterium]